MKLFSFIFSFLHASEYTFDKRSGVLFKSLEDIYVYDSEVPTDIAILVTSPRQKFRNSEKADCGDVSTGLPPLKDNFFRLKKDKITSEAEFCTQAFDTFDDIVLSYIGSDLQFTDKYNKTFDKLVQERRGRKRVRRVAPIVVGGAAAVTVVASGGYTWYVDASSKGRDEEIRQEIEQERRRITALEEVVELMDGQLDAAVKKIKRSNAPIITWGGLDIPQDSLAVKEIFEGEGSSINQFFAETARDDGRALVKAALTLTNHRLPLFSSFLDSVKIQCMAIQTVDMEEARKFCNHFAFHTTRWDTNLRFTGIGLTTFTNENGTYPEHFRIKEVVMNLRIPIPRMKLIAKRYQAINLGFFGDDGLRWRLDLPQFLVQMPSNEIVAMNPSNCLHFTPSFACATSILEPNQCGESVLTHNNTRLCATVEMDSEKCGLYEDHERVFVSIKHPSLVEFFHQAPSKRVDRIDSFSKTIFAGALDCGPRILKISAGYKSAKAVSRVNYIAPIQIRPRNVEDEEIEEMGNKIDESFRKLSTMEQSFHIHRKSTIDLMKETAKTEIQDAKDWIYDNYFAPILGFLSTLATIVLLIIVAGCLIRFKCCRKQRRPHTVSPEMYRVNCSSNRSECSI